MRHYEPKAPKICSFCGNEFRPLTVKRKTCSILCRQRLYARLNKEVIKKRRANYYEKNKEIERENCKKWYQKNRFSEMKKNKEYRKENRELFDWYHNKKRFNGLRKIILQRDNNKCRICDSKKVSIHHIDGRNFETESPNNHPENLITLCCSCHHKLHWWQRKNHILENQEDIVRTMAKVIEAGSKSQR